MSTLRRKSWKLTRVHLGPRLLSCLRRCRRLRKPLPIVLALFALIGGGVTAYSTCPRVPESTDAAQVAADMLPVATRVSGQVVKVHIAENQLVKKKGSARRAGQPGLRSAGQASRSRACHRAGQAQAASSQVQVVEASSRGDCSAPKHWYRGRQQGWQRSGPDRFGAGDGDAGGNGNAQSQARSGTSA